MKKKYTFSLSVLLTTILFFGAGAVYANNEACQNHQKNRPNFEKLAEKLNLTEEQKTSFIKIMEAQHEKGKYLKAQAQKNKKEMKKAHRDETLNALTTVLDAEQLAAMETLMNNRKKHRKHEDIQQSSKK